MKKIVILLVSIAIISIAIGVIVMGRIYRQDLRQQIPSPSPIPTPIPASFKITEEQAIEIAKNAIPEEDVKRIIVKISDHAEYGKGWSVSLILEEPYHQMEGKAVFIDGESGEVLAIDNISIFVD